jgi:hypothetical protein
MKGIIHDEPSWWLLQRDKASLQAVQRGLKWLQRSQSEDGSWGETNKGAMTGLALLCFLRHWEIPESKQYGLTVKKALQWFLDNGAKHDGRMNMADRFDEAGAVDHGIGTSALGEYYMMTKDERAFDLLKRAVGHIVAGQGPAGGWTYGFNKTDNNLAVSGWQIAALYTAHLTKLRLHGVDEALDRVERYLENEMSPSGVFRSSSPADAYSLTATGIYCRLLWLGARTKLRKGMDWLFVQTEKRPVKYQGKHADLYAWYFHTQACLKWGGPECEKWSRCYRDEIVSAQTTDGSWPIPGGKGHDPQSEDSMTGAVYRTTLCMLMLEYGRHRR